MTLLAYDELIELVKKGYIKGVGIDQINGSSIDITLGNEILEEKVTFDPRIIKLKNRDSLSMNLIDIKYTPYLLRPNHFILAHSKQIFNLPNNISAEYKMKSTMARSGLNHMTAGWIDAGFSGSVLTLELHNVTRWHTIELNYGDRIGQIIFFKHKPIYSDRFYKNVGHYNNCKTVSGVLK